MRKIICILFILVYFLQLAWADEDVRIPVVDGIFYPKDKEELKLKIEDLLKNSNQEKESLTEIFAVIVPHAGYTYSGQTAAYCYGQLRARKYKTVVVLAPVHYHTLRGVSVWPKGKFRTPLGDILIDNEFASKLLNKTPVISISKEVFDREHTLEVQLPFLQSVLSDFKLVPIMVGECSYSDCQKICHFLKEAIGQRKDVLVVASTDMYHGYDWQQADVVDRLTLSYLQTMDVKGLYDGLIQNKLQLCGGYAVVIAMLLAKELAYNQAQLIHYTNSAEVTKQKIVGQWTVGYGSVIIGKKETKQPDSKTLQTQEVDMLLNNQQKKRLLQIARQTIEEYLRTHRILEFEEQDATLNKNMGAFVTLHKFGQLRGCIGNLSANKPLYLTVRDMAIEAATGDPRFTPVNTKELSDIEIEISVLSPLKRVVSADEIKIPGHGVLVRRGFYSGVFLPQVASETGWSKEEFLDNLCAHKAGLPADAWKDPSTELYIFTAEVFSEKNFDK
ncbi:MAG: AmmeMemoRadiSam system protein B [Candidatus Omnitrophica bacterium]|nr:AmmeMemoRadiSam system protein B [Candidatus Omnitrophota bacterium]